MLSVLDRLEELESASLKTADDQIIREGDVLWFWGWGTEPHSVQVPAFFVAVPGPGVNETNLIPCRSLFSSQEAALAAHPDRGLFEGSKDGES